MGPPKPVFLVCAGSEKLAHIRVFPFAEDRALSKQDTRVRVTIATPGRQVHRCRGQLLCSSSAMPCYPLSILDLDHVSSVTTPESKGKNMQKTRRHTHQAGRGQFSTSRRARKEGAAPAPRRRAGTRGPGRGASSPGRVSALRLRVVASSRRAGQWALPTVLTGWRRPPARVIAGRQAAARCQERWGCSGSDTGWPARLPANG